MFCRIIGFKNLALTGKAGECRAFGTKNIRLPDMLHTYLNLCMQQTLIQIHRINKSSYFQ